MNPELTMALRKTFEDSPALRDLPSTEVLLTALLGINAVDTRWEREGFHGQPSVTDYAAGTVSELRRRYEHRVGMLG